MKKLKFFKKTIKLQYDFRAIAALVFIFVFIPSVYIKSNAAKPTAAYVDSLPNGKLGVLMYENGPQKPASKGSKISGNKALFVLRKYVAMLGFLGNNLRFDQFVQAGLDNKFDAFFSYPCGVGGGTFEIAWVIRDPATGDRREQQCKVGKPRKTRAQSPRNNYIAQNVKYCLDIPIIHKTAQGSSIIERLLCQYLPSLAFCPPLDSSDTPITVYPTRDENTLIQTQAPVDGTLHVDVLMGAVNIESDRNSQILTVEAGNRYIESSEGEGEVQDITSEVPSIMESSSLQTFLEPNNWSSNNAPAIGDLKGSLYPSSDEQSPSSRQSPSNQRLPSSQQSP